MPAINCPTCDRPLRITPADAGRTLRCPGCGGAIPVPAAEPPPAAPVWTPAARTDPPAPWDEPEPKEPPRPAPPVARAARLEPPRRDREPEPPRREREPERARRRDEERDRDEPRPRRREPEKKREPEPAPPPPAEVAAQAAGWRTTRTGLDLIYWGILVNVLGAVLLVGFVLFFALIASGTDRDTRELLVIPMVVVGALLGLAILAAGMMVQVGVWACCFVPAESRGKLFAVAAAVVGLNAWLVGLLVRSFELMAMERHRDVEDAFFLPVTGAFVTLFGAAAQVLFVLFLRRVARYFADRTLATRARNYLIFYVCFIGSVPVLVLAMYLLAQALEPPRQRYEYTSGTSTTWRPGEPWEEQQRRRAEEDRRRRDEDQRRHDQTERADTVLRVVAIGAGLAYFVAGIVNVVWVLSLVRGASGAIGKAVRAATEPEGAAPPSAPTRRDTW